MTAHHPPGLLLTPTLTRQSWLFMIGSALFGLGSALLIWPVDNARVNNLLFFVGALFFTAAGLCQLALSGAATAQLPNSPVRLFRAGWLAAATQSVGTLLFNVSTTAALTATTTREQVDFVWRPDAGGSVAFLVSAAFVMIDYPRGRRLWDPRQPDWWSAQINLIGCIAFGLSALGVFVHANGSTADAPLANWGTFIGAICFFLASLIALPRMPWNRGRDGTLG